MLSVENFGYCVKHKDSKESILLDPGKCLSFCFIPSSFVDWIPEHDTLDSGQVLQLMSWNRSRVVVFTMASGSHIKEYVFPAQLILRGLSSMPVCDSHLVVSRAYKHSSNQGIVWGEFFLICDYNTRSMRIPALSHVSDKKEDLHQIFIASFPRRFTTTDNHWLFSLYEWDDKKEHRVKPVQRLSCSKLGLI